jgi:DNA adenine methylase
MSKKKQNAIRSPLFYVGDKYKLITEIKTHFPTNINKFIEPFTGGGSVFLNVEAQEFYLNDIDSYIVGLHKYLESQKENREEFFQGVAKKINHYGFSRSYEEDIVPPELRQEYKKTYYAKFNKEAYTQLKTDFNTKSETDFELLYLLLIYGFNRMLRFNRKGFFNVPVGNVDFNKNVVTAVNNYFDLNQQKKVNWCNKDYKEFLQSIDIQQDDFIYFDPPYLITFSEYNKIWNEEIEQGLIDTLEDLNQRGIKFAVSNVTHYKGRENRIFADWAAQYQVFPIKSNYISYHDNSIKKFQEVLVTNYEL